MTLAMKLSVSFDWSQVSVTAMTSDLLQFIKSAKVAELFLMDLILIRHTARRLVAGLEFILTSPERINNSNTHGLICLKEYDTLRICPCIAKKGECQTQIVWYKQKAKWALRPQRSEDHLGYRTE